jgi:hypothetical protein
MVLIILPEMPRWGISYSQLLGAPGPSSSHEGGLRALFYSAVEVAGMADHTGPRVWISPFFSAQFSMISLANVGSSGGQDS